MAWVFESVDGVDRIKLDTVLDQKLLGAQAAGTARHPVNPVALLLMRLEIPSNPGDTLIHPAPAKTFYPGCQTHSVLESVGKYLTVNDQVLDHG